MKYVNITTDEEVEDCDAFEYAMDKLELTMNDNTENAEQIEFKEMLVDWYFSGNWIKEKGEEDYV